MLWSTDNEKNGWHCIRSPSEYVPFSLLLPEMYMLQEVRCRDEHRLPGESPAFRLWSFPPVHSSEGCALQNALSPGRFQMLHLRYTDVENPDSSASHPGFPEGILLSAPGHYFWKLFSFPIFFLSQPRSVLHPESELSQSLELMFSPPPESAPAPD